MKASLAAIALLALSASALAAQGNADPDKIVADGGVKVPGWLGRIDPRAETQGRKITEAKFYSMGPGIHVTSGPAAIYWNPANSPSGNYTVAATFVQEKASAHPEGYGLIVGARDLQTPHQSYVYFIVRQDGKYMINHRADDSTVHKIVDWTENPAVKAIDASGKSTNALSVVVGAQSVSFKVNGTEVHSLDRSVVETGTPGVAGIRVNHNLDVHIADFGVTKQ